MPLITGDSGCTTGMAKAIYDALVSGVTGFATTPTGITQGKAMAFAIATAVVAQIQASATVTVTVPGLGLTSPPGGGPVTGIAAGTGTVA